MTKCLVLSNLDKSVSFSIVWVKVFKLQACMPTMPRFSHVYARRLHNIQWWEFFLCLRKNKGPMHPIVFYGKVHGIITCVPSPCVQPWVISNCAPAIRKTQPHYHNVRPALSSNYQAMNNKLSGEIHGHFLCVAKKLFWWTLTKFIMLYIRNTSSRCAGTSHA